MRWLTLPRVALLAVAAVLLSALAVGVALETSNRTPEGLKGPPAPVTTKVLGADGKRAPLQIPRAAVDAARPGVLEHSGLHSETPAQAPSAQLKQAQRKAAQVRRTQEPLPTAGASGGFPGCVTRFVVNQSSRRGVRPQWIVDHYTVSYNRPGWSDVNAVVGLFNNSAYQASSNFVIDAEGNCAYIVPIEAKAWTQAAANPFSVSIEVIDYGTESIFLPLPGLMKLVAVHREIARRTGIPLRRGSAVGCAPGRSGIVNHADFGVCGGGHHDIKPFSIDAVVAATIRGGSVPVSPLRVLSRREHAIAALRCYHIRQFRRYRPGTAAYRREHGFNVHYQRLAGAEKRKLTRLDHYGLRHRGARRKLMAQTEAFSAKDRRAVCG